MGGIADAVSGIFGGGTSTPTAPNTQVYQPSGTSGQDSNLNTLLNQNTSALSGGNNPYSQLSPQILQAFQQLFSTPGTSGLTTAANNAGQAFTNAGNQAGTASGQLNTAALGMLPGATQVMNLGLDPQNALYAQQLQQTNDQANVANAQYGLTGQQAAGNVNQADTNFNIDWQNNQLQRAISALGAGGSAVTNAGTSLNTANTLGTSGAQSTLSGGNVPYVAGQAIGGNQETALNQYIAQLLGPTTSTQSTIGDLATYLGLGINASTSGADAAQSDYALQQQNAANLGSGLGSLAGLELAGISGGL